MRGVNILFVCISAWVVKCQDEEMHFSKSPTDVSVILGHPVTLPCEVTPSDDGIGYYWELNGSKISNTTRRYQEGSNLHITRVDRERDSGQFTCVAKDMTDGRSVPITSQPVSINIQYSSGRADFVDLSYLGYSEKDYRLQSRLCGLRNHVESSWRETSDHSSLLSDFGFGDTSSEKLNVVIGIGEASVQLQEPDGVASIQAGRDVVLRCHLDASGDVHYEWFRNSDRLTKSARLEIKKKRLHIKAVEPSDNGVYRCVAKNEAGEQNSTKNFALAVAGENTALVQIVPSDVIAKKGGTALFDCSYQHADVIEWHFKEVNSLTTNNRITIHSNGSLQIDNVNQGDQGMYSCSGIRSEAAEVPQIYTAQLKLAYIQPFEASSFEPTLPKDGKKIVGEGSAFQLTCLEPNSFPLARKWWENAHGHTISDSGEIRVDDGRLIIDSVKIENAGIYKCVAENIAGQTKTVMELIVTVKPKITKHPLSVTVDENQETALHCEFESDFPDHTLLRWRKDGKTLKQDLEDPMPHQRVRIFRQNGTLAISNTQPGDRGEYVCEVATTGQRAVFSKPATISVIEQLRFAPPPVNKKMELGSVYKIHCKAQGTPPPIIHWEKEGVPLESMPGHITDMNGTLHFNGVLAEDKGRYNCFASNSQGAINATINIEVVVAPKFSVLPKTPTEALEGQPVSIDCVVEGDPKPTIHWDKNLKMNDFDQSRFTVLENGTLYIREVRKEDENKYGCTAGSSAGLNRKEVQLIVHNGDSTVTKAVLITMSVAGAYIILVIGLMVWCRYRRRSRKLPLGDGEAALIAAKAENGDVEHTELKESVNTNGSASKPKSNGVESHKEGQKSDGAETTNSQSSSHSKKSKSSNYDKLALTRSYLKESKLIGRGEFGDVMVAKLAKSVALNSDKRSSRNSQIALTSESSDEKDLTVLVKALSQTKDENCLAEFKREIDMFTKLSHDNVVRLFGLCREVEPHYMILEHTDWGDLKKFLLATQTDSTPALTAVQSAGIVHQLSRGMDHLASLRMVHKDLAARNCLVSSTLVAKISMCRLTRDPYSQEYCKHVNQIIPLRWLPYEAVYEDEYSTKSDVYSFGVLIWEIFAQGELPQSKINDNSFLSKLKEKKLEWKAHPSTPDAIIPIQESCWEMDLQKRPSFAELSEQFDKVLKSM